MARARKLRPRTAAAKPLPVAGTGQGATLAGDLYRIYDEVLSSAERASSAFPGLPGEAVASRDNLLAYAALREHELADVQLELAARGLSSLGRLESAVIDGLENVLSWLGREERTTPLQRITADEARLILGRRTRALLGRPRPGRATRVMVTVDADALSEPQLFRDLVAAGVDLIRINTGHDSPEDWARIIASLREAEMALAREGHPPGRRCRIVVDLAGPKIRTGEVPGHARRLKLTARRIAAQEGRGMVGCIDGDAEASEAPHAGHEGCSFVLATADAERIAELRPDDRLTFADIRGKERTLEVLGIEGKRVAVRLARSAHLGDGTVLRGPRDTTVAVCAAAPKPGGIKLERGDTLRLVRDPSHAGTPANARGPASIACTTPEALLSVGVGDRVAFDDGKVWCRTVAIESDYLELKVESPDARVKLRSGKGINFPDSPLSLPALSDEDIAHLPFIVHHADVVGLSFVHGPEDVRALHERLDALSATGIGVIAKIETAQAVHNLGTILLAGLERQPFGVMIARGDLAVEAGFESLARLQEEILCLCEAGHTPVIWATQVLETLAKEGQPARAEITDAATGQRAECVMLNKGPYILDAVQTLERLLSTEEHHRIKKRQVFRELPSQNGLLRTPHRG